MKGSSNKIADSQLDPEDEGLPWNHIVEIRAMTTHSCVLCEATPERDALASELAVHIPPPEPLESDLGNGEDPTIFEALTSSIRLNEDIEKILSFLKSLRIRKNTPYFDIRTDISIPKIEEDKKSSVYPG